MRNAVLILLGIAAAVGLAVLLLLPGNSGTLPKAGDSESATQVETAIQVESAAPVEVDAGNAAEAPNQPLQAPEPPPLFEIDGIIAANEYRHSTEVAGVEVYWTHDQTLLQVGLVSPGTGYVAIGFDPESRMEGANYILGAVVGEQVVVRDDWGVGPTRHGPDVENGGTDDILALAGRESDGQTILEFVIPLNSGDPADKPLVAGGTYVILVSYHSTDDSFATRHSQRGSGTIVID